MAEESVKGRKFNRGLLGACAVCVAAVVAVGVGTSLSAGEKASLSSLKAEMAGIASRSCPNQNVVRAWERYRGDLEKGAGDLEAYLAGRDSKLDAFFPEYPAKSRNFERFKTIYLANAKALHDRARPVLAKDASGMPLPADAVFAFEEWAGINPTEQEAVPAQKKFWIQDEVVSALLDLAGMIREAKKGILPELLSVKVAEAAEKGFTSTFGATIAVRMHHADVPALASILLASRGRGLLTRLTGLAVEKAENVDEEIVHKVPEGGEKGFDEEAFVEGLHRPVLVKISFDVVDLR